jgi:hypothetical protein
MSQDGVNVSGLFLQTDGGTGKFALSVMASDSTTAAKSSAQSTTTPVAGVWYHLAGVYDQSINQLRLYVNGALEGTAAFSTPWGATGHSEVGRGKWGGGATDFVNGSVDESRIYGRAFADADVLSLYHGTISGNWRFDEGMGLTAADATGNGNAGALSGVTTWASSWTTGQHGGAINLDGASSYVDVNSAVVDTTASFTAMAWVKFNVGMAYQTILSQDGVNISGFFLQEDGSTGKLALAMLNADNTGATKASAQSVTTPALGVWYHVAGVYDAGAGQLRLYVNGVLEGTVASSGVFGATGHTEIGRGKWGGAPTDFMNGAIDGAAVYRWALRDADVNWAYNNGL